MSSGFGRGVFHDFKARELPRTVRAEWRALVRFYLDEERRADLERMRAPKRVLAMPLWILRSLLLKLTPARRVLLIVALATALLGSTRFQYRGVVVSIDATPWAFLLLLFVLALELKDKLLARDEIAVARQVQLALLPSRDPAPPGWTLWSHTRPANDVGGDLIDYLEAPTPGTLGVALGDVAGKGLGAALLMAKLQASLRAVAPGCRDLGALGDRLNGILCRDGLENRFATLFYLEAPEDGGPGPVRFLNAGHNPPLLVRASGVEEVTMAGRPLGMFPDSTFAEGTLRFDPGDLLIVYSDGLIEASDASEREFGLERLKTLAPALRDRPPAEAGRLLVEEVDRFLGEMRPHDDLSIVLMRQGGAPSIT
ncbi:MAG TPA: PP2C family protein-serine/threonine phosphatase [Candidatus Polarisedimenticolia bacterium]|nr:PP2C family protein-serine/threonine phosphatase [Candidatus Polarisedimenticolia bacterium]